MKKESQEFKERKELMRLQKEIDDQKTKAQMEVEELRFKRRMELLRYERENTSLFHEKELERGRIKRAEERKLMEERDFYRKQSRR